MSILNTALSNSVCIACDFCFLKLENSCLIQCVSCKLDICLYCFLDRSETDFHSKFHSYKITNCSLSPNKNTWNLLDELFFINGLELHGIGNWEGISQSIGTKSLNEIELHFYDLFNIKNNSIDLEIIKVLNSNPYRSKLSTYMPGRRDLDVDLYNDEEENLKDIDIQENENEDEIKFKKAVIDCYSDIIKIRENRMYLILERNLIDLKGILIKDKHNNKFIDTEKYKQLLPLIKIEDYNRFLEGIYIEKYLKKILKEEDKIEMNSKKRLKKVLSKKEQDFCDKNKLNFKKFHKIKEKVIKNNLNGEIMSKIEKYFEESE